MSKAFLSSIAMLLTSAAAAAAPVLTTTVSGRVFHDTNVFLQDDVPLQAGQTKPGVTSREHATAVEGSVTLAASWKRASGTAEVSYMPQVFRYFSHDSEDHTDHTLAGTLVASGAEWSTDVKARYLYVDGSRVSPVYNGVGGSPAVGGEPVRARREQAIGRASGRVTRRVGAGFVRGVFSTLDQNFHTREQSTLGYANYVDRHESTIGIEGGIPAWPKTHLVAGVRSGFQRQANLLGAPINFSNTLTRWLVGFEGAPTSTLKLTFLAGPDVRRYGTSVRPGFQRDQRTGYGEASLTWTPGARDNVTLTGKRFLWLPGGGRGVYADMMFEGTWRRKLADRWSGSVGGRYHEGNTSHFATWAPRNDRIYTTNAGVTHTLPNKMLVALDVMHDWGVSLVRNCPGREYSRWITSLTATRTW